MILSAPTVYCDLVKEHDLGYRELKAVNPQEMMKLPYHNMEGADAVIATMIPYGAGDAAEKMDIPMIHTLLNPAVPTKEISSVVMPHKAECETFVKAFVRFK